LAKIKEQIWPVYKWATIFCVIFLVIAGVVLVVSFSTTPNPNLSIMNTTSAEISPKNGTALELFVPAIGNITSNDLTILKYWVNSSSYELGSAVVVLYFNGNHSTNYNSSQSHDIVENYDNYMYWWTQAIDYTPLTAFDGNPANLLSTTIDPQPALTNITFQFLIKNWNGLEYQYIPFNGTYTIQFSEYEVFLETQYHSNVGTYWTVSLVFWALIVVISRPFSKTPHTQPSSQSSPAIHSESNTYEKWELLVDRCNHLDTLRSNLRTGASIFLTLGVGVTAWAFGVLDVGLPYPYSLVLFGILLGSLMLIFFGFLSLLFSFSDLTVENEIGKLNSSLFTPKLKDTDYKDLLALALKAREKSIYKMTFSIGIGVVEFTLAILMMSVIAILPYSPYVILRIPGLLSVLTVWGSGVIVAAISTFELFGEKGFGIYVPDEDE